MPAPESGRSFLERGMPASDPRVFHRVMPLTRRDWLLQAGAGFGALALLDLLTSDAAAGPESRVSLADL